MIRSGRVAPHSQPVFETEGAPQMADYVIVGAGTAGCVLAARLSEDPDVTVLLLEAGGPDTAPELHIPAMFPVVFKSSLDWDLLGEPEPGLGGRRLYLPRGRVIEARARSTR